MVDEAERLLQENGIRWREVRLAPPGTQHRLYRVYTEDGKSWVLKVARTGEDFGDVFDPSRKHLSGMHSEIEAVQRARNIRVPKPIQLLSEEPPAALMPFLPGEPAQTLWERGRLDEDGLRQVCFAMGRGLAGVHSVRRPQDDSRVPDLPDCERGAARLLHMDYHLGNVQLVRDRRRGGYEVSGVVDWVLCRWGPREADFVEMNISVFRQIPGSRSAFMGGYRSGGGMPLNPELESFYIARELERRLDAGVEERKVEARWMAWLTELRRDGQRGY